MAALLQEERDHLGGQDRAFHIDGRRVSDRGHVSEWRTQIVRHQTRHTLGGNQNRK